MVLIFASSASLIQRISVSLIFSPICGGAVSIIAHLFYNVNIPRENLFFLFLIYAQMHTIALGLGRSSALPAQPARAGLATSQFAPCLSSLCVFSPFFVYFVLTLVCVCVILNQPLPEMIIS